MAEPPEDDATRDFTLQISEMLEHEKPYAEGSFGWVYRCMIESGEGKLEVVAAKVFKVDTGRAPEKNEKTILREYSVWLRLKHPTIVRLLGIATVKSPFPALISQWMPRGTLYKYLEQDTITISARVKLAKGIADGLKYLHSENVIHGDLHPGNVLIDDAGSPRLTDFGLATIVGDEFLQLSKTTADRSLDPQWRAPEIIGIDVNHDPEIPTFESDIYSFGSIMFYIISGHIPWKKMKHYQVYIALSSEVGHTRPDNIFDYHWKFIKKCWSGIPASRPRAADILEYINDSRMADLTGQVFDTSEDHVAGGAYGNVYKREWRGPLGTVKVAVKAFIFHTSEQGLKIFRQESAIWTHLVHDNIVTIYGTTEEFGPTPALVSPWFLDGTLLRLITEQGVRLCIRSKLKLLHGIASGLHYLHSFRVVHGDVTSSNVLVEIKEGEYKACLTDFGLSEIHGELVGHAVEGTTVRLGAIRWTAPELLKCPKATKQNDIYSFGRVMFHLLTLTIPWHGIDDYEVVQKILNGEEIPRPEMSYALSDMTDDRWNQIKDCWSVNESDRPSAFTAMDLVQKQLEASKIDDVAVGGVQESHNSSCLVAEQVTASVSISGRVQSQIEIMPTPTIQPSSRTVVPSTSQVDSSAPSTYRGPDVLLPQNIPIGELQQSHQSASPNTRDAKKIAVSNHTVCPAPRTMSLRTEDRHANTIKGSSSIATTLFESISGPFNVLVFGQTGVGKSSVINLILGQDIVKTSPDAETCTLTHDSYEICLKDRHFKIWEVSSIKSMGSFRTLSLESRLPKNGTTDNRGIHLLLYCMRGSRSQKALVAEYMNVTKAVGSRAGCIPVAAVITCLEDYPRNMDDWWIANNTNLGKLGMQFSAYACVTSLPEDSDASRGMRVRRLQSQQAIRSLICGSVGSSPPAPIVPKDGQD